MAGMPFPVMGSNFQGFNVGQAEKQGLDAAAPLAETAINLRQMGVDEEKKRQAIEYQKLLRSGADGMRKYAAEVTQQYPEVGQQISQEAEQYAGLFQDPNLSGDKAEQFANHFYESANNRIKAIKDAKATTAKPYAPTTQDEAVDFYRRKKEIDADTRPARGTSNADRARSEKRMQALRQVNAIWSQIEEMQSTAGEVPLIPGTANPDVRNFVESQPKEWRSKWDALRTELRKLEAQAGLQSSTDIIGPDREQSESYKLFNAGRTQKTPASGGVAQPKAAAREQTSDEAAIDWLKSPESKNNPYRSDILAALKARGVDVGGL